MSDRREEIVRPVHPGRIVREILGQQQLSVLRGAAVLNVQRATLSNVVNEHAKLTPEMALRIEKAFGVSMETLMQMQTSYDIAQVRSREREIAVNRYAPELAGDHSH